MKALILAGGKGTRLVNITNDEIPKPMAVIAGKPIIVWAIETLKKNGVNEIIISVNHLKEKIMNYLKDGRDFGVQISYIEETTPLGSGGSLFYLKDKVSSDFIVCSGDTIFDINIKRMLEYHKQKRSEITLLTHPNIHPFDSDLIETDENGKVLRIDSKNNVRDYYYNNNVNAGFFIINPSALDYFKTEAKVNMEHDFINSIIEQKRNVFAYKSTEFIKDVGTVDRFYKVEREIQSNLVANRNYSHKQKAIFLDRDGTINVYKGFINNADQIELLNGVSDAIKMINESEYLAIIVSNQPVIARGEATKQEVDRMFKKIDTLLGEKGAFIDAVYYCPHHPKSGFEGEVKELKINCDCRKPKIGLLEKAVKDYNLDLSKCFIIGDSNLDIQTGINANIPQIRVDTGKEEYEKTPCTKETNSLIEAVEFVLNYKPNN